LSPAGAWRWCVVAGIATLAASTAFGYMGIKPCGDTGGAGAIIALELVRTPAALAQLFLGYGQGSACSDALAAAQGRALLLDSLAFIPAYGTFLFLAAKALGPAQRRLAWAAMAAVLAAALLDEVEGLILSQLLAIWQSPPDLFDALFWVVQPKFALLGIGEILIAALLLRGTWFARIAALPMLAGGLVSLYFLFANPYDPLMMRGHRWAWTALLIVAILAAIRPSLVARTEPA